MFHYTTQHILINFLNNRRLQASAAISGNSDYPNLNGIIKFYSSPGNKSSQYGGAIVEAEIFNLPDDLSKDHSSFFGFHIHEYGDCSDNFSKAGSHFNPENTPHPYHAGDMPPLLSNHGYAWTAFYDDRISISDIINRSVIIHRNPDDFTTQPSGNSGEMIGCGVIKPTTGQ